MVGPREASSSGDKPVGENSLSCANRTSPDTDAPPIVSERQLPGEALDDVDDELSPPVANPPESEQSEEAQQFFVNLEFPGQGRPRLIYRVYANMPVRLLYQAIADGILECEDYQIRLYVDDKCLLHTGTITVVRDKLSKANYDYG